MNVARHKSRHGFTLVELLIGASLSAAIMAAVLSSYIYLGRGLTRLGNQQTVEMEARRTIAYFAQDIQSASGVSFTSVTAPDFYVTFTLANSGTNGVATQVTYYYSRDGATPSICGNTVTVPAHALVRALGTGSALTQPAQVILRNIVSTDDGCYLRFYDSSGSAYDNGSAPYTTVTTYSAGIKQAALAFNTQLGNASNGTRTPIYSVASSRLVLRNKTFLP